MLCLILKGEISDDSAGNVLCWGFYLLRLQLWEILALRVTRFFLPYHQDHECWRGESGDPIVDRKRWEETTDCITMVPAHHSNVSSACWTLDLACHLSLHTWSMLPCSYLGCWLMILTSSFVILALPTVTRAKWDIMLVSWCVDHWHPSRTVPLGS